MAALKHTGGIVPGAAHKLGTACSTLCRWITTLDVRREEYYTPEDRAA